MPSFCSPQSQWYFSVSPRLLFPLPRRNPLTFARFMRLMDDPEIYKQMLVNLFGRHNLLIQMAMITHIWKTIDNRLEAEMHWQWNAAQVFYGQMEQNGLEDELGDNITQTSLQSSLSPSNSDKSLLPYRRTPSPDPSVRRRQPTLAITIVFPEYPPQSPTLHRPQQPHQPTPFHSSPIGSQENLILVEEDNDDTMYCNICRIWGHKWSQLSWIPVQALSSLWTWTHSVRLLLPLKRPVATTCFKQRRHCLHRHLFPAYKINEMYFIASQPHISLPASLYFIASQPIFYCQPGYILLPARLHFQVIASQVTFHC